MRFWRWTPCVSLEIRELIRQMSTANPLWGAPRIHGELLKLGIQISQATVAKYMVHTHGHIWRWRKTRQNREQFKLEKLVSWSSYHKWAGCHRYERRAA